MIQAQIRNDEETFDMNMQMLAWQTALLMNATGNFKRKIKPSNLYSSDYAESKEQESVSNEDVSEVKKKLQEELLSTFNIQS